MTVEPGGNPLILLAWQFADEWDRVRSLADVESAQLIDEYSLLTIPMIPDQAYSSFDGSRSSARPKSSLYVPIAFAVTSSDGFESSTQSMSDSFRLGGIPCQPREVPRTIELSGR